MAATSSARRTGTIFHAPRTQPFFNRAGREASVTTFLSDRARTSCTCIWRALFGEGNIAGGGETSRIFDITANDQPLTTGLDVIADAPGSNTADMKVFKNILPASDEYLHLKFLVSTKENPFLNAIEIVPGLRLRPVRIVARETAVTAKDGQLWGADRSMTGGQTVLRTDPVWNTAARELS